LSQALIDKRAAERHADVEIVGGGATGCSAALTAISSRRGWLAAERPELALFDFERLLAPA
jgi:glycerol-3-phosphate dehydrogenase